MITAQLLTEAKQQLAHIESYERLTGQRVIPERYRSRVTPRTNDGQPPP